jgi:hypothetical protein
MLLAESSWVTGLTVFIDRSTTIVSFEVICQASICFWRHSWHICPCNNPTGPILICMNSKGDTVANTLSRIWTHASSGGISNTVIK